MTSRAFQVVLIALCLGIAVAAWGLLRLDNARLRRQIAARQAEHVQAGRQRAENQRTQELLARVRADGAESGRAVSAEVARLRAEVRALEQSAEQTRAALFARENADRASLASNRDPRAGLVALEHFQASGQGTPSAAWQTFVWAAKHQREDVIATLCVVSPEGRARAERLIGDMPEAERAHWTPEKLGRQFFHGALGQTKALEIARESSSDAQRATLRVRLQGKDEVTFEQPMQLGSAGWQVVITDKAIAAVEKRLRLIAERSEKK